MGKQYHPGAPIGAVGVVPDDDLDDHPDDIPQLDDPDDEQRIISMIREIVHEAQSGKEVYISDQMQLNHLREQAVRRYLGDHWDHEPQAYLKQATANKTQNAIITSTAVQTEQPPAPRFEPRESGEPPQYVLTESGVRKLIGELMRQEAEAQQPPEAQQPAPGGQGDDQGQQRQPSGMTAGGAILRGIAPEELVPNQLLDQGTGEALAQLMEYDVTALGEQVKPILEDGDLIVINDQLAANVMQDLWDTQFKLAWGERYFTDLELLKTIIGDQAILIQWHQAKGRIGFYLPNTANVWYDPICQWVDDARYVVMDQLLGIDEAVQLWPEHARKIKQTSAGGYREAYESHGGIGQGESPYSHVDFRRGVVTLRTAWIRNQDVPDSEGFVAAMAEQQGKPMPQKGSREWSTHKGIRQIQILVEAEVVVDDRECPYAEIPCVWLKNVPIPFNPHGIGEPGRLEGVQQMINRLVTICVNHFTYYQYPQEYWPASLLDELESRGHETHSHPGRIIPITDDFWDQYFGQRREIGFAEDPPELNDTVVRLLEIFLGLHDDLAHEADVLQGQPPSPDSSGRAIAALQTAARGPIGFKARHLRWTMEWIARIAMDAFLNPQWMTDELWAAHLSAYPPVVRDVLRDRARALRYDVAVDVSVTKQADQERKSADALELQTRGAIGLEDLLIAMQWPDPKRALLRRRNEDRLTGQPVLGAEGGSPQGMQ